MRGLAHETTPRTGRRGRRLDSDAGFALVEVMVSAVLLLMLALATLPLIDQASSQSSTDRSRGIAASLAAADQQRLRQMPAAQLGNYRQTSIKNVDGIVYNIQSRADISRDSTGVVACQADTASTQYYRTQTTITWPRMANVDPLVVESIVSPGVAALANGSLTVKLQRANGGPQPGISVSAGTVSETTDAGGCAVFALLAAGTVDVTWDVGGFVDKLGNQSVTKSTTVSGNSTANVVDAYDQAATVPVQFKDAGTPATNGSWPTLSASNTGISPSVRTWGGGAAPGVTSITASSLFPFPTNYGFYAGTCTGNDPTAYNSNYFSSNPGSVLTSPGATSPMATVYTRSAKLTVRKNSTNVTRFRYLITPDKTTTWAAAGGTATGTKPMAACTEQFGPGGVNPGFSGTFPLPWGLYTICVDDNNGFSTRKRTITFQNTPTATATAQALTLDVGTTGSTTGSC